MPDPVSPNSVSPDGQSTAPSATPPVPQSAAGGSVPPTAPAPASFPDFSRASIAPAPTGIDLLSDVSLQVRVELGRTRMLVEDVLRLGPDSVVELDKSAGDPIDIYVNGRHVARGEVLVLNENFCIRVSEIIEPFQVDEMPEAGAGPTATLRVAPASAGAPVGSPVAGQVTSQVA